MDAAASWDVIIWVVENACDLVPSSWASNTEKNTYMYPNINLTKKSKIKKLISKCQEPDLEQVNFIELRAVYKRTVNNFYKGQLLVEKLTAQSSLDSEGDGDSNNATVSVPSVPELLAEKTPATMINDTVCNLLLKSIATLQVDIKRMQEKLANCESKLDSLLVQVPVNCTPDEEVDITLPLEITEELEALELRLCETNFKNYLTKRLQLVGGNSVRQNVCNILRALFKQNLALQFSCKGKKNKKNFSTTKLYPLVLIAVRKKFSDASDVDIAQKVSSCLASAGDWDGGAKLRLGAQVRPKE